MKAKFYETVSPGPGSYRFQSEFGIYSPEDANNEVEAHEINQAAATQRAGQSDEFFSPRNSNFQSARNKNMKIPLSSTTGFNTEKKTFSKKKHFHQTTSSLTSINKLYAGSFKADRKPVLISTKRAGLYTSVPGAQRSEKHLKKPSETISNAMASTNMFTIDDASTKRQQLSTAAYEYRSLQNFS